MTGDPRVGAAVADAHRREWAFVLAATVRVTRDIDLAEECVQDAYAQALSVWTWQGIPARVHCSTIVSDACRFVPTKRIRPLLAATRLKNLVARRRPRTVSLRSMM